jgi:transglutaminase-like putative cysteine protease
VLNFSEMTIPPGRPGTAETLRIMGSLIREAQVHPITRSTALRILALARSPAEFALRVRAWVRRNLTLVDEAVEMVARPEWMLQQIRRGRLAGDCDDAAALGIPVRLVAVARPEHPNDFFHVYPEALVGGDWAAFDPTTCSLPPADWPRLVSTIA